MTATPTPQDTPNTIEPLFTMKIMKGFDGSRVVLSTHSDGFGCLLIGDVDEVEKDTPIDVNSPMIF